jgi:hypothetical protein
MPRRIAPIAATGSILFEASGRFGPDSGFRACNGCTRWSACLSNESCALDKRPGMHRSSPTPALSPLPDHQVAVPPVDQNASTISGLVRERLRSTAGLRACRARGYDLRMDVPRGRRIWHFEVESLCDALDEAGAWQTALRIRVAHRAALQHRPDGASFDVRPTPEDAAPLNLALDTLRAERARERLP